MKSRKPLVYIAPPFSNGSSVLNMRSALDVFDRMLDERRVIPIQPLLVFLAHLVHPRAHDDWLAYDIEILSRCDAVFACHALFENEHIERYFENRSSGRDRKVALAQQKGIPVFWNLSELYAYFDQEDR